MPLNSAPCGLWCCIFNHSRAAVLSCRSVMAIAVCTWSRAVWAGRCGEMMFSANRSLADFSVTLSPFATKIPLASLLDRSRPMALANRLASSKGMVAAPPPSWVRM